MMRPTSLWRTTSLESSRAKCTSSTSSRISRSLPVVVPSGSCAGMMKRHYPALFEGDPLHEEAEAFAARVVELTQFLSNVLKVKLTDRGEKVRVTWHSSCHALREMGIVEEPRTLLAQLENLGLSDSLAARASVESPCRTT